MKQLTVEATQDNLAKVIDFVNAELEESDCPMKAMMQAEICVEEIFINIVHYAYPESSGQATVCCGVEEGEMILKFLDAGVPYDPLAKPDPDVTLAADQREIGGLGIYMVKKSMDRVEYAYADGMNQLTLIKKL